MSKLWNFTLNHRTIFLLLLLILASIFLRFYNLSEKPFWEDEALYSEISQEILQGDLGANNIPIYPPSFFYLNAIGQFLFGNTEFGSRFFTALLGSLSILLIFLVGRTLFNKTAGLFAASLLAFSPEHILFSREALPFVIGMFFFLLAFYAILKWVQSPKEKQRTLFFLSLIAVFLSFIFHFVISSFFIILIPFLIKLHKRRFGLSSVILITTALMVFLYFFANLISSFFFENFLAHFSAGTEVGRINAYIQSIEVTQHIKQVAYLLFENYFSAQYLFIPPLLIFSLLFFPKQLKRYRKSLFTLLFLFVLLFLLMLRTATSLDVFFSFPSRLHIFASFILYLFIGFSLFLLFQKNKKLSLAIFTVLLFLFISHSPPILAKKLISVSDDLSSLHLVKTQSIVCSSDYYLPLTVHTFINAFLFCFPHHPVYYNDDIDWRKPTMLIENVRRKNAETIIFSSYTPIASFYLSNASTIYKGNEPYREKDVYKGTTVFKSLHCNSFLPFCPDNEKLYLSLEFDKIEERRSDGETLDVFFIIDAGRYDWQLTQEEKELIDTKCLKYESDFFLYEC